jgi:signal transduction histidine kinase
MKRRIRRAIVGVSAVIVCVLGLPLAVAVRRSILDSEIVRVQVSAADLLTDLAIPLDHRQIVAVSHDPDAPRFFAVYSADGTPVYGANDRSDPHVRHALRGDPSTRVSDEIEVFTPIPDRINTANVLGAVRVSKSLDEVNRRTAIAWAVMAASALVALLLARFIGDRLARRLAQPISDLADAAEKIGDGSIATTPFSGVDEIDNLATALRESAARVNDAIAHERHLTDDISHQLRTPLTSIRLQLEAAIAGDTRDLGNAMSDVELLEDTLDHLLSVARDATPVVINARLEHTVRDAVRRWQPRVDATGRSLRSHLQPTVPSRGAPAAVAQILDVLIDNAILHGAGDIDVTLRRIQGGTAIDVRDEGATIGLRDVARIFERGEGDGNGIGLAVARTLAEAEGGRLLLSNFAPSTFSLILVEAGAVT